MATINDVARECGVSLTTVSLVLNKRPHTISLKTQERIFDAARRLNYHPSALARGLMNRRVHVLGVMFSTVEPAIVTNPYAAGILSGVFWAAAQKGYQVLLFTTSWEGAEVSAAPFRDGRTDGVLLVAPPEDSDVVSGLAGIGLPVVVASAPAGKEGIVSVDIDNRQAGRLAAEHLLSLGHTRIGQVMGTLDQASVRDRRDGCLEVLEGAGVITPPEYLVSGSWVRDGSRVPELLSLPEPPTALFCSNDDVAVWVCQIAREMGRRIPEDLSVIGCDDYRISSLLSPPLTTIHHPLMTVGHQATDLLIQMIETGEVTGDHTRRLPVELIVRGSTAPR